MTCNHNWSEETHEGVPSRFCHVCNEWEIEVEYDRALAEVERLRLERDEARRDLGEILAVIHRDGGHHTGEHGVAQSVSDAHATWAAVVLERDELRAQVAFLRDEYGVNADDGTLTRDALEQKIQVLIHERRQLLARLVECRAWAGRCPYPNTPAFDELIAIRDLADDTLEEVQP